MKWISDNPTEERYYHTKGSFMSCYWHNDRKEWDKDGITHWLDESSPSYTSEQLIEEIGRRQKLILSEPAGSVRETMIENLLIDLP